ncbi:MAG: two-component system C4-dicarboxylate transport sensor histidine kinase DctB [Paracoccaceae bacterium]|jgi:two-component system C4-dicarboxylate transport sensor histidine kinase DctB
MVGQTSEIEMVKARTSLVARLVVAVVIAIAILLIWISNLYLTDRFTQETRSRAELRMALYAGNISSELQRTSVVPLLLSRDPVLISALSSSDYVATSQRLISIKDEIGAASLMLLDEEGRTVAATDRRTLGSHHRNLAYFVQALRSSDTVFTTETLESGGLQFSYSRKIINEKQGIGVIVVEVDLAKLEQKWAFAAEAIMVTNSEGIVILSSEPKWKSQTAEDALKVETAPGAIERALKATADFIQPPGDTLLLGSAILRLEGKIGFQGWRLTYFTSFASVRERVNGVLALEIMGFAILVALVFYVLSRRAVQQSNLFQRESIELRALNDRLSEEITERERVERSLRVAEQSLAQSSKLAALGEMSAAVSHELNQPLAAMRTYLAGAKLLLQRHRPDEALSSFQRIDDLIGRMAAITRQLKSYARKGGDELVPVDLRTVLSAGLTMMEPQLNQMEIKINQVVPREPVLVLGDQLRLEQVIVNLLRNALDAVKELKNPELDIHLTGGEIAKLSVRDNGSGIDDLDQLFEPFYTTKKPGDGVGLGLAISSGIVGDLDGRLTARNAPSGGAIFEIQMPELIKTTEAAE